MATTEQASRPPTRERLIEAATELIAERGYAGTSVGEIEEAAGLVPRSGALYKHFPSKRALLEAALAERVVAIDRLDARIELLPLADVEAELTLVGRIALEELEGERELARIVMKEGDRFPELADRFHAAVVRRGHRIGAEWLRRRVGEGDPPADVEASAQVLTDALVGYALQQFIFGERLEAVERERFIAAWVELARGLIDPDEGRDDDR